MAGVSHQDVSQKIASEFSEIHLNEAQLRRYVLVYRYSKKGNIIYIYRFVTFFELYDLLINNKLKYSKLKLMIDLNEGIGLAWSSERMLNGQYADLKSEGTMKTHKIVQDTSYITCWSKNKSSIAMWLLYSKNKDYIRIRTTKEKLKKYSDNFMKNNFYERHRNSPDNTIQSIYEESVVDEVSYINLDNKVKELKKNKNLESEKPLFLKNEAYSYEAEIRGCLQSLNVKATLSNHKYPTMNLTNPGKILPNILQIDVNNDFIDEICFDPRMPLYQQNIFIQILNIDNDSRLIKTNIFGSITENILN